MDGAISGNAKGASATLTVCAVTGQKQGEATLTIYQTGDALAAVFRPVFAPNQEDSFYFQPLLITTDSHQKLDYPFQYRGDDRALNGVRTDTYTKRIREFDLALLAATAFGTMCTRV